MEIQYIDSRVKNYFAQWINFNLINSSSYVATLGLIEPAMVRQHFLFYSTWDILCFCQFHQHLLKNPGSNIFTAIGFNPCSNSIQSFKKQFPNASTITVFDNNLLGKVLDCKVLLSFLGKNLSFKIQNDKIVFIYNARVFSVSEQLFSLHHFRSLTGFRYKLRTIKPKGAISFSELLAKQFYNANSLR